MPTMSGPKSRTRKRHRHSGIRSSHSTCSMASIWVVSRAAAPPTMAVDAAVLPQRLERLGQEAALAHDGAGAVVADQALGETAHAGRRGRADAHRLVRAVRQLAHVRGGV